MTHYNAPHRLAAVAAASLLAACAHAPQPAPAPLTPPPPAATVAPPPPAPVLQPQAPKRYTVKKGDTLWGIASMYLKDPWLWPDIWYANPAIKNPHLIFPGDVIILGYEQGRPTLTVERNGQVVTSATPPPVAVTQATAPVVSTSLPVTKLEPQVHYLPLSDAVPALPLSKIRPFLSRTRVVDKDELEDAGYLLRSLDGRPAIGNGEELYARGLQQKDGTRYDLYRLGDEYVDPDSGDSLGYQATYIGQGSVESWGDPQKVVLTDTAQEALAGDRFLPSTGGWDLNANFFPHAPAKSVNGQIMAVLGGVEQIGQFQVVVLNRGSEAGLDPGMVLAIYRKGEKIDDPYGGWFNGSVTAPRERSGTLMVFRVFKQVSYALVMQATHEIHLDDIVANP